MPRPNPSNKSLFLAALDIESDTERAAFLKQACGDNCQLREEIESLLDAHVHPADVVKKMDEVQATIDQPIAEKPGTQIGPFKLLQQVGEGGMGVVYMAEQKEPVKRRVALKIIKPGMDTRQVIARFEAERQALAMMDHPNIAKVLDAGATESGRPYFVMELVNGISVTQYCDQQHLTPKERLELFVPVCQAVQHAHQKGIIHRDLKPSNILVAEYDHQAVPKIIDFGVAKATSQTLTDKTMFTQLGQIVGTLEYMSPEQAKRNQLDVDTRSDIYSLGVVLYELLTGETPFDRERLRSAVFDEMLRIIREEEPPKPSTKMSASESLPSIAVNRHMAPQRLTSLVRGELDWIVMKALEKDRARRYPTANGLIADIERYLNEEPVEACPPSVRYRLKKHAQRNKSLLATLALILMVMIIGTVVSLVYAVKADRAVMHLSREKEKAEHNLQLANAENVRAEDNLDLAMQALDQVYLHAIGEEGLVNQQPSQFKWDPLTPETKQLLEIALEFYERLSGTNASNPRARFRSAMASKEVHRLLNRMGSRLEARKAIKRVIEQLEHLTESEPENPEYFLELGTAYAKLAEQRALDSTSNVNVTELFRLSFEAFSRSLEIDPNYVPALYRRARAHQYNNRDQALKDIERAIQLEPNSSHLHSQAAVQWEFHDPEKSLQYAERALQLEPDNGNRMMGVAFYLRLLKRYREAEQLARRVLELDENSTRVYHLLSQICSDQGKYKEALEAAHKSVSLGPNSARAYRQRANVYECLGDLTHGLEDMDQAVKLDGRTFVLMERGRILSKLGRFQEWEETCNRAIKASARKPAELFRARAAARFYLRDYAGSLEDWIITFEKEPIHFVMGVRWLPVWQIYRCRDPNFRTGLLDLADRAVVSTNGAVDAHLVRGRLKIAYGQSDGAIADWTIVLDDHPQAFLEVVSSIPFSQLAQCANPEFQNGLLELADRAVESTQGAHDAHRVRGQLRTSFGRGAEAFDDFSKSIESAPNRVFTLYRTAWFIVLLPERDPELVAHAVEWAEEAAGEVPNTDTMRTLLTAYYRAGRWQEAIDATHKAIELDNIVGGHREFILAMAHHQLGNHDQARQHFEHAVEWMDRFFPDNDELILFREEVRQLFETSTKGPSDKHVEGEETKELN